MEKEELLKRPEDFRFMLLGRLVSDCEFFLDCGKYNIKYLWADNEKEHIATMRLLYSSFEDGNKPMWLSEEKINEYERKMVLDRQTQDLQ